MAAGSLVNPSRVFAVVGSGYFDLVELAVTLKLCMKTETIPGL